MHNLGGMARLLLNGESRLLTLCTVNGLGVAEKSLVTTPARDARSRPSASATDLQKGAPASSLGCVAVLLVAVIVDPTARGPFVRSTACRRQESLLALPLQQQIQCRASGFVQSRIPTDPRVRNCAPENLEIPRSAIALLRSGPSDHPGMTCGHFFTLLASIFTFASSILVENALFTSNGFSMPR